MSNQLKVLEIRTDDRGKFVQIYLSDGLIVVLTVAEIEEAIKKHRPYLV